MTGGDARMMPGTEVLPLPVRLSAAPRMGVVGRAVEAEQLATLEKLAFTGDGSRMVLLSGEPGIGKTTLAGQLAQRAHLDGAFVLYGRCDEDIGAPYQPMREALRHLLLNAPDPTLEALDRRHLVELSRLLPDVHKRLPSLPEPSSTDAEAERYLLLGAVTGVLTELARIAPVLVVLDDLHWADKPTVVLLRHLATTLDRAEVLIVGTYRDTEVSEADPLAEALADLRREATVERMGLDGLDDAGVVALIEGFAGHEMDDEGLDLARSVRVETGGNPFFTAEVLRHLVEIDAIRLEGDRWITTTDLASITLPESVREVVGQRVRRLGETAQVLLTAAAIIGRDFGVDLLARTTDHDHDAVWEVLEDAVRTGLVAEVEGQAQQYTFTHALFQHVLYEQLSAARRVRVHRRIAEVLEAQLGDEPGDRIGELAHHWVAGASPLESTTAAAYAQRAGRWALAGLAPDVAAGWFRRALDLIANGVEDPLARLDALIGLGDAQRQDGDPAHRETLLDAAAEAERLGAVDRLVAAVLANSRGIASSVGTPDVERIALLESAAAAHTAEDADRALVLATLAGELLATNDFEHVRAVALEAEELARRIGDDDALLRVLNLTFLSMWVPSALERSLAVTAEAMELAERSGDPVARFWAALIRLYACSGNADREGIDQALELTTSLSETIGQPFITSWALQVRCPQVLLLGDAEGAERLAEQALDINLASGQPDAFTVYGANLAGIRQHQGRLEEFLPLIADAARDNPGIPAFQAAYAQMLAECGRLDDAAPLLAAAREADFHHDMYDYGWITMTTLWADTAVRLRDLEVTELLYDRLLPFAHQGVTSGATFTGIVGGFLARCASVLGSSEAALLHFEEADRQLTALRAPAWLAYNQVEWARELALTGGDLVRGRGMVVDARALAEAHGCAGIVRRADEVLADHFG